MAVSVAAPATAAVRPVRVRHFMRLKLRLLGNGFRGSGWRVVLFIFGALAGLYGAFSGFALFTLAGTASVRSAATVTAIAGSVVVLGWVLMPLLFFGVDETLDPARFALLPVPRRTLAGGMLAAAFVGIPAVATLLGMSGIVLGAVIRGGVAAGAVAVVGVALGILLCVTASRAITSAFAGMLRSRRVRDLAIILIAVFASTCGLVPTALSAAAPEIRFTDVTRVADVLAWTPLGAPFAAPYDIAAGHPLTAAARLLLTLATIGVLVRLWMATLEGAMIGTASSGGRAKRGEVSREGPVAGLYPRLLRMVPRTRGGALLARETRYWWRDARRRAGLVSIMVASMVFPVAYEAFGRGTGLRLAVIMSGVMGGLGVANQFGYDGTAYAAHVLAGVPGRVELRARAGALAVILGPLLVALIVAVGVWRHETGALPAAIGILVAGFGVSLAASSIMSVIAAYPMPESQNPFAMNTGAGTARGLLVFAGMLGSIGLTVPVIVAGFLLTGPLSLLVLPVGLAYGAGAVLLGTYLAGDRLDNRGPELLAAVTPRR